MSNRPSSTVYEETRAHISLKHSLDPEVVARYIRDCVHEEKASSLSTTESSRKYLKATRSLMGDEWILGLRGEYIYGVLRENFARKETRLPALSRLTKVYLGRDDWRDLFVLRRIFVHRATGRMYAVAAGHPPATVQNGEDWNKSNPRGVRASKRGLRRLGRWVTRIRRKHPFVIVAIGLDTNVNHHTAVWRERLERLLTVKSMWSNKRPPTHHGTHGDRLIDAIYSNAPMSNPRISTVKRPRGMDHRPVAVDLHFTAVARR